MMTTDREQLEAQLAAYVDGRLSPAEQEQVHAYLDQHPDVRTIVEKMMIDSEHIRALSRLRCPLDIGQTIDGQVERDMLLNNPAGANAVGQERTFTLPAAAIAAIIVLGVAVGIVAMQILGTRPTQRDIADFATTTSPAVDAGPDAQPAAATALDDDSEPARVAGEPELSAIPPAERSDGTPPAWIATDDRPPVAPTPTDGATGGLADTPPAAETDPPTAAISAVRPEVVVAFDGGEPPQDLLLAAAPVAPELHDESPVLMLIEAPNLMYSQLTLRTELARNNIDFRDIDPLQVLAGQTRNSADEVRRRMPDLLRGGRPESSVVSVDTDILVARPRDLEQVAELHQRVSAGGSDQRARVWRGSRETLLGINVRQQAQIGFTRFEPGARTQPADPPAPAAEGPAGIDLVIVIRQTPPAADGPAAAPATRPAAPH